MNASAGASNPRLFTFLGGREGLWRVVSQTVVCGAPMEEVGRIAVVPGRGVAGGHVWALTGVTSHERYVERHEHEQLQARQEGLGRGAATCAALIPIRKNDDWWRLSQDERREILETRSQHIAAGMRYLPEIARRLHHCRDLPEAAPFDFLTWFEYAPEHAAAFDELAALLRASEEWRYVERETDIRMVRDTAARD